MGIANHTPVHERSSWTGEDKLAPPPPPFVCFQPNASLLRPALRGRLSSGSLPVKCNLPSKGGREGSIVPQQGQCALTPNWLHANNPLAPLFNTMCSTGTHHTHTHTHTHTMEIDSVLGVFSVSGLLDAGCFKF